MPHFKVTVCYEVWEYHHIIVEAADEEEAEHKVTKMVEKGDLDPRDPDEVDGNGFVITGCDELPQ
jgi:hypothetical protein